MNKDFLQFSSLTEWYKKLLKKSATKKDWNKIVSVLIYHVQKLLMQELLIFLRLFLRRTEAS